MSPDGIASFLKSLRTQAGHSQQRVAEALGVPLRTYQSWERSYQSSAANLLSLADCYGIAPERFFSALAEPRGRTSEDAGTDAPARAALLLGLGRTVASLALSGADRDEILGSRPELAEERDIDAAIEAAILDEYFASPAGTPFAPAGRSPELEARLVSLLGLDAARVVVVDTSGYRLQALREMALAPYGAAMIRAWGEGKPLLRLGISNGYTIARILDAIPRSASGPLSLFPLNFTQTPADFTVSTTSLISSFLYRHEGRCAEHRLMGEDEVYGALMLADAALLGIGTLKQQGLYSRMITATLGQAYLDGVLAAGAIGDFNYYPIGRDGLRLDFPELVAPLGSGARDTLIKSAELELLARKADRNRPVAVAAAGAHKAELVRLVAARGYVNTLLVDSSLAESLANE